MPPGRRKDERVWQHYHSSEIDKSVRCKFCEKIYKYKNIAKMTRHLETCFKSPTVTKDQMKAIFQEKQAKNPVNFRTDQKDTIEDISTTSASGNSHASVNYLQQEDNHFDSDDLATQFAHAVFVSRTAFSMTEEPLWINFFEKLNFKMPSRKSLATKYLEKIYKEMRKELDDGLSAANYLHLQLDGWSNVRNEGIVNFLISKPEPVFVESLNTENNRHTGHYLAEQIERVMQSYNIEKFVTLIGDNAKNMQNAFERVKMKHPHIVPMGCCAHTLNLLSQDCGKQDSLKEFLTVAVEIIKSIKKSQVLSAELAAITKSNTNSEKLKLPSNTRWGSTVAALKSLRSNRSALKSLAIKENIQIPMNTKTFLLNEWFWTKVEESIKVIEPITECIFKLEGNDQNIHKVFMTLKDIKSKLEFILPSITIVTEEEKRDILAAVDRRTSMCIRPIHMAAYMLDPKTQGLELNQDQRLKAMEFINDLGNWHRLNVMGDLANYIAREGFWGKQFLWDSLTSPNVSSLAWWKGLCASTNLSKIALRILTAPCTSAATERSFSAQANIHSNRRNRLTTERAGKVTFISYNWRLLHKDFSADTTEEIDDDISVDFSSMESPPRPNSQQDTDDESENLPGPSEPQNRIEFVSFVDEHSDFQEVTENIFDDDSDSN